MQSVSTSASPDNRQSLDSVQLASMSKAHAFEAMLIMAGGVINQDATLGSMYATPGAKKVSL